jgi:hypothetical protein
MAKKAAATAHKHAVASSVTGRFVRVHVADKSALQRLSSKSASTKTIRDSVAGSARETETVRQTLRRLGILKPSKK